MGAYREAGLAERPLPPPQHHRPFLRLVVCGAGGHRPLRPRHPLRLRHPAARADVTLRECRLPRGEDQR